MSITGGYFRRTSFGRGAGGRHRQCHSGRLRFTKQESADNRRRWESTPNAVINTNGGSQTIDRIARQHWWSLDVWRRSRRAARRNPKGR